MNYRALCLVTFSGIALLAACGGAQPTASASEPVVSAPLARLEVPAPAAPTPTVVEAPPVVVSPAPPPPPPAVVPAGASRLWQEMTKVERADHMKNAVLPKLGPEFAKWNPKHFNDMKCAGCHGAGAKDKSFKMPNPDLPKLPMTPEGFKALAEKNPAAMKFMKEQVMPRTAKLLGLPPFDMATHQGFGCGACHTFAK